MLTLPAHDLDVVLGKYLAAVGIYTVALGFSLSNVFILRLLGAPDLGVLFATYLGYWLMGALLIAIGMVASLLSSNVTVAFILGALFCSVPIFLGRLGDAMTGGLAAPARRLVDPVPVPGFRHGGDHPVGAVLLRRPRRGDALLEHGAPGPAALGRRRGQLATLDSFAGSVRGGRAGSVQLHGAARTNGDRARTPAPNSCTRLSSESTDLIKNIPADRPVLVQVYYSPEVPRDYVEIKADLLGLLKEYEARSGGKIRLNLVPTELFSTEAHEAEKRFGIEPRRVFSDEQGKQMSSEVFLGVAFTSGVEEVVIPFFDRGLPVEYELTRSIRVVSKSGRKKVGILTTDAKLTGGMDMRTFSQTPEWSIVTELKKQYDVSSVSPDTPISSDLNVLLVAQPSSLTQKQIDNLTDYIKKGGAALLFLDPFPADNPSDVARAAQDAAGRPVRRRPASRAQGRSASPARPGRARLAVDRDRLECLQSTPQARRPAIDARDRLHRQGQRSARRIQ